MSSTFENVQFAPTERNLMSLHICTEAFLMWKLSPSTRVSISVSQSTRQQVPVESLIIQSCFLTLDSSFLFTVVGRSMFNTFTMMSTCWLIANKSTSSLILICFQAACSSKFVTGTVYSRDVVSTLDRVDATIFSCLSMTFDFI